MATLLGLAPAASRWWPELPWKTAEEMPVVSPGLPAEPQVQRDDGAAVSGEAQTELAAARQ